MRKLADLYYKKRPRTKDFGDVSCQNMKKEDRGLVEDLMRDSKMVSQVNNACKDIMKMPKLDKEQEVATFTVNMSSAVSSAANVQVNIILLKDSDESDLRITLRSLVHVPAR